MNSHRIGLDIRMLQNSGIGTYLRGLLSGWEKLGLQKDIVMFGSANQNNSVIPQSHSVMLSVAKHLERDPSPSAGLRMTKNSDAVQNDRLVKFTAPIYSVQEQFQYPSRLKQCRLWHAPHYNVPLWKGKTKLVVTIHDIIHWIFRKQFLSPLQSVYAGFMLRRAVRSADQIIAVSHYTKKDLIEHFRAPESKITVIHQGIDESNGRLSPRDLKAAFENIRTRYDLPENFFLYVGLMKPHKNVLMLVRLFRKLKEQGKVRASLVLIGRKDKAYPPGYEELASLKSTKDIILLPVIDHAELKVFYNQALALVHPSLYEGFGLTPLEAMSFGAPVLTTNSSSIPEVVGDAALRVDASDEAAMAEAILRLDQEAGLRESLRQKGFERARMFTWAETARKTAEVYEKALAEQ